MKVALTVLAILAVLVGSEFWWRRSNIHGEFSRKFVHITVGSFVAFWPWYLSWHQIELMGIAFLIVIGLSKYFNVFEAIHTVQRPTWGEMLFAAAVGLIALITHDKWIYAASILMMSLADGLAAVVGVRYGGKQRYSIFGYAKSLMGSAAFFVTAMAILLAYNHFGPHPLSLAGVISTSVTATLLENLAVNGLDNLMVPLLITVVLANR